ncbi:tape measure protein [Kitasatospora acidiphila]|uniref:Tape measure protein n=1 Tax=Kitasatospora acidiphila TaxID=2567942 RepID=A0A540W4H4_9ACTN|nr:tape measure protein [Kitasatospora acidiphila]TQF03935.1 tape measure protein [Kitasatospora acidiphila]
MAGGTTARSAGVAYIDLAVGDAQALIDGITRIVRQAASTAQEELSRGFDVSGNVGSFQALVDAAATASADAAQSITGALTGAAQESSTSIGDSITNAVSEAATAASESLVSTLGDAGRQAGEQMALNFEEATQNFQLTFFDEEDIARATEQARLAAERAADEFARVLSMQMSHDFDASNASLGSVFSSFQLQGLTNDVRGFTDALTGGLRFAATGISQLREDLGSSITGGLESARSTMLAPLRTLTSTIDGALKFAGLSGGEAGGKAMSEAFSEFGKGITYSVGSWGIGFAIGNSISTGISSALSAAKSAIFDFNSQLQSAQISFGTLLGSDSAGSAMLNQIKQFALSTPYQFGDLIDASQKLLALGISANNIIPDLRGLGDATSALGGDSAKLNGVVQIFGEMQSKGQIMEANIRELQIRGIPALQILANEYGVSTTEFQKMVKSGKVMADDALPRLIDGLEKGTKSTQAMGGEMAKQSLTFKGSMSNLKDGLTQFAAGAGKPVFDLVNSLTAKLANFASGPKMQSLVAPISKDIAAGLKDFVGWLDKLGGYLMRAAPLVKDLVHNLVEFSILKQVFQAVGPVLLAVAQAIGAIGANKTAAEVIADLIEGFIFLKGAQEAWNAVMAITDALMEMNPLGLLVLGVSALVIGLTALYQHSKTFRDILADIGGVAGVVWSALVTGFDFVKGVVADAFGFVERIFKSIFDSGPARGFFSWLSAQFSFLRMVVVAEIGLVGAIFAWLYGNVFAPIGSAIVAAIQGVGAVFVWLWKNILSPVVDGIWFTLRLLFVIVTTLIVTPFLIAYHLLEPLLKALWHSFSFAFGEIGKLAVWLWKNALKPAFDWIGGLFSGQLSAAIVRFWRSDVEPAFRGIGEAGTWLWKNVFVPVGHGISDVLSWIGDGAVWLWKNVLFPAYVGIAVMIGALGAVFAWLWQNAIGPALSDIADGATWLWKNALEPAFHGIADSAQWLYINVLKPVFDGIGTAAKWVYDNALHPVFDDFVRGLQTVGDWAKKLYDDDIKPVFDKIGSVISGTLKDVKTGFDTAVSGINAAWSGLVDDLKGPVSFLVNTVYTNGIEEVWNYVADKVGIPKLPDAPHFATGGVVDGPQSAGDWIPIYATAGEGILTTGEMDALGGPSGFRALRAMLGGRKESSGDGHFNDGGIVGTLWGGIKSVVSAAGSGLGSLESFADRIVTGALQSVAKDMLKPVLGELGDMMPGPSTMLKSLVTGIPSALIDKLIGWFGQKDKTDQAQASAGIPTQVASWIDEAERYANVGSDWTPGLGTIIHYESGGDPNIVQQIQDVNSASHDPARGLMQTIMATFEAYRLPSLPDNVFDPVANIVAGIRYILARYGSIRNVPGLKSLAAGGPYVGYATGTNSAPPGWAWVGEQGPELLRFSGGEAVIPASRSLDLAKRWSAPQYSAPASGAVASAPPIVNVFIDGEKFDGRIRVQIEDNNNRLAQILNGGVIA